MRLGNQLCVVSYAQALIIERFGSNPAVRYLDSYLADLKATSVLIETKYVDRHFLDDYAEHYARTFSPPPPHCERWHFFAGTTAGTLATRLRRGLRSCKARKQQTELLQQHYLGYVCRRPIPDATLGRTVLRTYDIAGGRRNYSVVRDYRVNLAGFELVVQGLAFQQQDGGAAVCASTALWSAFQQVARLTGARTPTPIAVTRASGSPFPPSHGLGLDEMASAISAFGFGADEFARVENSGLFRAQLLSFLRSELPVVVFLAGKVNSETSRIERLGHAVTVTGYASPTSETIDLAGQKIRLRGAGADVVYVHDDNLGSHAHYELRMHATIAEDGAVAERLVLFRGDQLKPKVDWWTPDAWVVSGAIVPRPSKIRMPIEQLYQLLGDFQNLIRQLIHLLGAPQALCETFANAVTFDAYYGSGIAVQRALTGDGFAVADVVRAQMNVTLPRYVSLVEVSYRERVLLRLVYDASALVQHQRRRPLLFVCPSVARPTELGVIFAAAADHYQACVVFARQ